MARFEFQGVDEYLKQLRELGKRTTGYCKKALYEGANVVANQVRSEVSGLPTAEKFMPGDTIIGFLHPLEKQGLLDSLDLSTMRDEGGYISTVVTFGGYNSHITEKYPNGQPNQMIANSVNSGTSRRPKNPFLQRAISASRSKAESAMAQQFEKDIAKIMKRGN